MILIPNNDDSLSVKIIPSGPDFCGLSGQASKWECRGLCKHEGLKAKNMKAKTLDPRHAIHIIHIRQHNSFRPCLHEGFKFYQALLQRYGLMRKILFKYF